MAIDNFSDDIIYNWRNELKSHHNGVYVIASSQAQKLKNQGFNKSEVVELLAADNYDLDLLPELLLNFSIQLKKILKIQQLKLL